MEILQQQFNGNQLRMIERDGQPWFVLGDVCAVLDLTSPHKVATRLDDDERTQAPVIDAMGRAQDTTLINESGLYAVILRSDKAQARPFRKWITNEVLPALRTKGSYTVGEASATPALISARLVALALDCSSKSAGNRLRHRGVEATHHLLDPICGAPAYLYPLAEVQAVWPNVQFQPYSGLIHAGTGEVDHRTLLSKQGKAARAQHLFFDTAEELGAQLARTMVEEFISVELPARMRAALSRGVLA